MSKLNLGCGLNWKTQYPDYEGLDILNYGQTYVCDALTFKPDKTYTEVIANHFLEHFDQDELRIIFNMVHRCLEPGGVFKFCVPHKDRERAWLLSHKTMWNETTVSWLGECEASNYGFPKWKVVFLHKNERRDIHAHLLKL